MITEIAVLNEAIAILIVTAFCGGFLWLLMRGREKGDE